jgi:NADPH:quinone reductase-like Zn-dependent oxidoreductase
MPKAYVYTAHGDSAVEAFHDLPIPAPGPGELLVRVRAAGVNPVDWKRRTGYLPVGATAPALPAVFGSEVAGIVERVGARVTDFAAGDAVFGTTVGGGYAEYALVTAEIAAHKPARLSFQDAATLPVAAATAHDGLRQLDLPAGARLLITGAGGGVGVAATQIARHLGITVIGTASLGKKGFVESLGAVHVASGPGVADRIREAVPTGIDAIFDLVGGADLEAVAVLLDDRDQLITAADRATVARLGGSPVRRLRNRAVLETLAEWVVQDKLRPYVTDVFSLTRAGDALRHVEDGHARGKTVIAVTA